MKTSTAATRNTATVTIHAIRERGTRVFCRAVATSALTPDRALRRLGEFSVDVRAAVLLGGDGTLAAHTLEDEARAGELAGLVGDLFDGARRTRPEPVAEVEVATPRGTVFALRTDHFTVAVVARRLALSSLMRYDLCRILGELEAGA